MDKYKRFVITSVCKADILEIFKDKPDFDKVWTQVESLTDKEMKYLASKLSGDYCNQLFWTSLKIIFKDMHMK